MSLLELSFWDIMTIRVFNLILCICAGAILVIPFLIVGLLIKLTSPGPLIHWSKRIGKNNHIFLMPKFRTMRVDTPQVATHLLTNGSSYLTPVGSFLRKTSLDELPQLWSVFTGEMSFVGPRPALFNQDDLIELRTKNNIHLLPPGITGWAQINGRDDLSIDEKVKFDKEYLDRKSLFFDIKILFKTVSKVFLSEGITH